MFKRSKRPEKKGSEKREDLLVSFWKDARFVFAIIYMLSELFEITRYNNDARINAVVPQYIGVGLNPERLSGHKRTPIVRDNAGIKRGIFFITLCLSRFPMQDQPDYKAFPTHFLQ